jgi:hypothetical protein
MAGGPWRPANIKSLPGEAAHVINQAVREINGRIDVVSAQQRPYIKGSSTLAFGTVGAQSTVEATVHISNANSNGVAHASPAQGIQIPLGLHWSAYVSGQNQVRVRLSNITGAPIAVPAVLWNVTVTL